MSVQEDNANSSRDYAFNEVHALLNLINVNQLNSIDPTDPVFRYLCALFAEIAYYSIPEWEIDKRKRAKLNRIPSKGYKSLIDRGIFNNDNVAQAFASADLPKPFITSSAGIVAVGVVIRGIMFIGFRGTALLFDWKVNVRAELVRVESFQRSIRHHWFDECCYEDKTIFCGGVHSGFAEESVRITKRILGAIPAADRCSIKHVFLCGHSLGGAIAALSKHLITEWPSTAYLYGAPRYSDVSGYMTADGNYPIQTRRPGDLVPTVPPRSYGFCDHPNELATNGEEYIDTSLNSWFPRDIYNWIKFLCSKAGDHMMESYRMEIGKAVGARFAEKPLTEALKISKKNI